MCSSSGLRCYPDSSSKGSMDAEDLRKAEQHQQENGEAGRNGRGQGNAIHPPCTSLTIVCSFLDNLLQMDADPSPTEDDLGLLRKNPFDSARIANALLFLWRNKDPPTAKEMLDRVNSTCCSHDHLRSVIEAAIDSKITAFRDVCRTVMQKEVQPNTTTEGRSQDPLLVTLQKKTARIAEKKEQVVRLLQQKRQIVAETEATLLSAAKKLEAAAHGLLDENSVEEQRYDQLMNTCIDVVDHQLEVFKMEAKLKYYTTDKIDQLREQKIRLGAVRSQLELNVSALEVKKKEYESLGPEFRKIAKDYGNILREIEVENRIRLAFPSP
ncbi:hypothetical protein RvY_09838 [Ramazzottius varieornatus]|uniref:Uncharacterized protein n=1 Tax=Ramazzottius varieornatus TaxID=947166 RepID=A0A1D1VAR5_RAMVA|nr:hypothetical protein RvY_09838 [Ramazzottius varieornatus]